MNHVYAFDHDHGKPHDAVKAIVGGKAANIAVMATELGFPVPPGFTISTATCRSYLASGWPSGLDEEVETHMRRMEAEVGQRFGDAVDPLLVSVRSGAPVSMPGMMDTILNLGLNDATSAGLVSLSGDAEFVAGCRDRFTETYREIVGVSEVPEDPWMQLRGAIEAVFRSWNSERARSYRAREGIPDDLATGVTVQTMVFGNRGADSGTGVVFTRDPATGERTLYGDVMFQAQGEDVVAGTHRTEPIGFLDERMPDVASELRGYADILERHYRDVCDIEFTIEAGRLWMLQVRVGKRSPQAALRIAVEMAEDPDFPLSRAEAVARVAHHLVDPPMISRDPGQEAVAIATGLAASPGLASGEIATTPDAAVAMAEQGRAVILVRAETSPDDVHGMAQAAGILTSTGGLASHAAVVARGWGIPAVVGAAAVQISDGTVTIGDHHLHVGDELTIDGATGDVFVGAIGGAASIVPEAATLLSWAEELGFPITSHEEEETTVAPADEARPEPDQPRTMELLLRALLIKGFATPDGIAPSARSTAEEAGAVLDRMVADGAAELAGGMFRLTEDGKTLGCEMMAADRQTWGVESADAALDAFLPLDHRMKEVVTAWQMREVDGEQALNDHTDLAYDEAVLGRFASLHTDAASWLDALGRGLARLAVYATRLSRAAELVEGGEHLYIASPRVDSYHSVWFELHEDLILLSGRTRADEVAAGRA